MIPKDTIAFPAEQMLFASKSILFYESTLINRTLDDIGRLLNDPSRERLVWEYRRKVGEEAGRYKQTHIEPVYWSGIRDNEHKLVVRPGCIWLELVNSDPQRMPVLRKQLISDPHTFALFANLAGNGLNLVVRADLTTSDQYGPYIEHLHQYLQELPLPEGTETYARIDNPLTPCWIGVDQQSWFNRTSQVFTRSTLPLTEQSSLITQPTTATCNVCIEPGTDLNDEPHPVSQPQVDSSGDPVPKVWEDPQPISTPLLPVLAVTPDTMLPQPLRPWLVDMVDRMKCPLDFVASAVVVLLSALVGTRLAIKPKQNDDWTIIGNLWGATIGDPATMKTPSVNEVFKPLKRLGILAVEQHQQQTKVHEAEVVDYEIRRKFYQSQQLELLKSGKIDSPMGFPEAPKKPTEQRYMTNDATVEKLAELLNENPTGLLVWRDELIGLLAGWDRSGHEQDRAFYLEAWNGDGSQTVDRISRGTIHVKNVCVSLFGGIQPAKLLGYLQAATGYDNDGFVQRLQVAVYPDKPPFEYTDESPDKRAKDRAFELIKNIATSCFDHIGYAADEYNRFPYTRFDEDAQALFKDWLIDWETNVLPGESGLLLEHFTKYRSLMPSLALLFHVVNCVDAPPLAKPADKYLVSAEAAQMAITWCKYLQSHARRIYGLLDTVGATAAKELLKHLKKGDLQDGFSARDVYRKGWSNLTKQDQVDMALAELVTRHWLREVQPPPPVLGRPTTPQYHLHPQLLPKA